MHVHTHTHTHTRARARARVRTHTNYAHTSPHTSPTPSSDVSFSLLLPTRHLVFLPSLSLCLSLLPIICPWQRNKEPSKPGVEVKLLTVAIDIRREREQITATLCTPVYRCKIPVRGEIPVKIPGRLSVPVPRPNCNATLTHPATTPPRYTPLSCLHYFLTIIIISKAANWRVWSFTPQRVCSASQRLTYRHLALLHRCYSPLNAPRPVLPSP